MDIIEACNRSLERIEKAEPSLLTEGDVIRFIWDEIRRQDDDLKVS
jgi:allophanate hydrolase subunit 1